MVKYPLRLMSTSCGAILALSACRPSSSVQGSTSILPVRPAHTLASKAIPKLHSTHSPDHMQQHDSPDVYLTKTLTTSSTEVKSAPHAAFAFSSRCSLEVCLLMNW